MPTHIRNLLFEGGGVKGIAYVGALERLEKEGILPGVVRVGGTSAGAINAVLLALRYSEDEVREILWGMDFRKFMDSSWNVGTDIWRLINQFGWYKGDYFSQWIRKIIAKKTGSPDTTFRQLHAMKEEKGFRDLYLVGTNLSTRLSEVFSHEDGHHPDMKIARAVRISMSIPLFFRSVRRSSGDCYVDGGVLQNYPVKLFDRASYVESDSATREYYGSINQQRRTEDPRGPFVYNKETLGFRLDSADQIRVFSEGKPPRHHPIVGFVDYMKSLVTVIMEAQQNQHLHSDDWHRTVYINTLDIETTQFDLTEKDKQSLVKQGVLGVDRYLEWYRTDEAAKNRPTPAAITT